MYDERFIRMWLYYLYSCEAGFAEQFTTVVQFLYANPECRTRYGTAPGSPLL